MGCWVHWVHWVLHALGAGCTLCWGGWVCGMWGAWGAGCAGCWDEGQHTAAQCGPATPLGTWRSGDGADGSPAGAGAHGAHQSLAHRAHQSPGTLVDGGSLAVVTHPLLPQTPPAPANGSAPAPTALSPLHRWRTKLSTLTSCSCTPKSKHGTAQPCPIPYRAGCWHPTATRAP